MTMPSSVVALHRPAEAVRSASQHGQSTGALLSLAGEAAPGPGHPGGARAGLAVFAHRGTPQAQPKRHSEE
jgi:hypothetical protein